MRRKDENLKDTLLSIARRTVQTEGTEGINIRTIAKEAGVATGTVYNYFADKNEILLALTEEYWRDAMTEMELSIPPTLFLEQLKAIYQFLYYRIGDSGKKLMTGLNPSNECGHEKMKCMHQKLRNKIVLLLQEDKTIPSTTWTNTFSIEACADFMIENMMLQLRNNVLDIDFFIEIVRRCILL